MGKCICICSCQMNQQHKNDRRPLLSPEIVRAVPTSFRDSPPLPTGQASGQSSGQPSGHLSGPLWISSGECLGGVSRGSFSGECLKFQNDFQTRISARFATTSFETNFKNKIQIGFPNKYKRNFNKWRRMIFAKLEPIKANSIANSCHPHPNIIPDSIPTFDVGMILTFPRQDV